MSDQINRDFAALIASGDLADRTADRMAGWVRCVTKAYCMESPQIASVRSSGGSMGAHISWPADGLVVRLRATGQGDWCSPLVDVAQPFIWTADGSEWVVGRGLEVRI